ncbi:MAG TPA: MoaD/ThiS family protein [Planctomycetota bacterium]|nr:MoaD/ThiS family protein [Planctomycetota bacterium]
MSRATTPLLIKVRIPTALRDCCGGAAVLTLQAATPRAVLEQFESRHPELYRSLCDETGSVRRHISVFVNSTRVDRGALDTELGAADVVSIFPAVSGG